MKLRDLVIPASLAGAGMLLYGTLVESHCIALERRTLRLPLWPCRMNGYRVGLLADFHLRDRYTSELAWRACEMLVKEAPDAIAIAGDFLGYWKPESIDLLINSLAPLESYKAPIFAVPGNHDYWLGEAAWMEPILDALGVRLLRNEVVKADGIAWMGIDSLNAGRAVPVAAAAAREVLTLAEDAPTVAIWHEPDAVDLLPCGCALMLSGHTHGGQFRFPGGFTPMSTKNGRRYVRDFFPDASTPLYVSRGLATTGPPSRFLCPPEVSVLSLVSS